MSFRFHYFSHRKGYQRPFSARNFLSSMNKKYKDNNNYQELNINTIRSMQLSHDINKNKKIKEIILSKNLENEINSNNLKEILPLMLTYNNFLPDDTKIENEKINENDIECSNIISCFQLLIKFLYEKYDENEKFNEVLENKISALKQEKNSEEYNKLIQKNSEKINELQRKKILLKAFLQNNGKKLPIEYTKKLYICDICPDGLNQFNSYRAFHKHYVKNHINPYSFYNYGNNIDYNNEFNTQIDSKYFDTKMDDVLQKVMTEMKKTNKIINENENNKYKTRDLDSGSEKLKSNGKQKKNNLQKMKFSNIRERIEKIQNSQKEFENQFNMNVDNFLKELKNEIKKLK